MIRFSKLFLVLTLAAATLQSCDKIEAPYVIPALKTDTSACPVPQFPVVTNHVQRVLLEDYTGHNCPNCPSAALVAHELENQYGERQTTVIVHAGFFAKPSASDPAWAYDFRTDAGNQWDTYFKISAVGNPNGMVNRLSNTGNFVVAPAEWASSLKSAMEASPLLELQLITEFEASTQKLCIHTKASPLSQLNDKNLNISILIVEDSIVQPQKNSDPLVGSTPSIPAFVHMNVLRGAVNGAWGDVLFTRGTPQTVPVIKSYQVNLGNFNLNPMVASHCRVVAFIYDADSRQVLQVAETAVK